MGFLEGVPGDVGLYELGGLFHVGLCILVWRVSRGFFGAPGVDHSSLLSFVGVLDEPEA